MNEEIGMDGMAGNNQYKMTVDLNVLGHLGIDFNSNIAAVLTEAIASAWDADAENVVLRQVERKMKLLELQGEGRSMWTSSRKSCSPKATRPRTLR
ncbi:hypothetical protein [Nitrosomonas sp.]|uniref:hypothetical protein n=1 Tax=Nitrosomonas sp. TaxID=42353 RepID=UPI00260DB12D|nr:hypothetical protein [Nitrosomonas sp.]MCW5600028.1 hypothetical protein [Nitrosomonas sp.]